MTFGFNDSDNAIDDIIATCGGDMRGALKALMLVNERLETELRQLYDAVARDRQIPRGSDLLH
jgi:hypothetical protein